MEDYTKDMELGHQILLEAMEAPFNTIMENAGLNAEVIWNKVMNPDMTADMQNVGFDARKEKVVDMFKSGIIDPAKVTRVALEKAASVAGTMLTTECVITNIPKDEPEQQPQMPGMM